MRVVEVNPRKERRIFRLLDPGQGLVHHLVARTLDRGERNRARFAQVELVEVGVETLVDAPLGVEHVRANEPAGAVAAALEHLSKRQLLGSEKEAAVVTNTMFRRELAGENAGVDRKRQWRDRHGL